MAPRNPSPSRDALILSAVISAAGGASVDSRGVMTLEKPVTLDIRSEGKMTASHILIADSTGRTAFCDRYPSGSWEVCWISEVRVVHSELRFDPAEELEKV